MQAKQCFSIKRFGIEVTMIELHFCEYNRSNQDYDTISRPSGSGDYLLLLLKTPMKVYLREGLSVTRENACILYTPGYPQHYQAVRRFCNSYLHFSSDEDPADRPAENSGKCPAETLAEDPSENIAQRFCIPENEIFYPPDPQELDVYFQRLQQEFFSSSPYREEAIHCLVTELFIALSRSLSHPAAQKEEMAALYPAFQKLRLEMLTNCEQDWSLERLCRRVSLEKSQFYSYYHSFFSSTPKGDLLQVRLEKAKTLLSNEALQVGEAARLCGFDSPAHFSRYFRKYCGCSPTEYKNRERSFPVG